MILKRLEQLLACLVQDHDRSQPVLLYTKYFLSLLELVIMDVFYFDPDVVVEQFVLDDVSLIKL